jgi:hypothetical protein
MLLRITAERWSVWSIYLIICVTVIFSIFYFFFLLFACSPIQYAWTKALGNEGHCLSPTALINATYAHGAVMVIGDMALVVLPCILVYHLQMPIREKVIVVVLLTMGALYVNRHFRALLLLCLRYLPAPVWPQ